MRKKIWTISPIVKNAVDIERKVAKKSVEQLQIQEKYLIKYSNFIAIEI